jgi:hypothetical protein
VLGGGTSLSDEEISDAEALQREGRAYSGKEQKKRERKQLFVALISGFPFWIALTRPVWIILGIFLIAGSGLLVLWLSEYGLFTDETAKRMRIVLPLCVSMTLFFVDQGFSWQMYAIPIICCLLIWIMPKNFYTKNLRQEPPSTWKKWE